MSLASANKTVGALYMFKRVSSRNRDADAMEKLGMEETEIVSGVSDPILWGSKKSEKPKAKQKEENENRKRQRRKHTNHGRCENMCHVFGFWFFAVVWPLAFGSF